jgi:hypothetical protein
MHPNLGRDIPLLLGAIALLIGISRATTAEDRCTPTPDGENPQWFCRAMFYFIGTVLICLGVVGHYSPY